MLAEDLGPDALVGPHEPEEDVLGTDVVVAERDRFPERQLERLLPARRERNLARLRSLAATDDPDDVGLDLLERDIQRLEYARRDPLLLAQQPEEDVLRPDGVVTESPGLVLGEDDDLARALGEALEHRPSVTNRVRCPTSSRTPRVQAALISMILNFTTEPRGVVTSRCAHSETEGLSANCIIRVCPTGVPTAPSVRN